MLGVNNYAFFLTPEQYEQELAERRKYLDETNGWDTLIGCPDCWKPAGSANASK